MLISLFGGGICSVPQVCERDETKKIFGTLIIHSNSYASFFTFISKLPGFNPLFSSLINNITNVISRGFMC